MWHKEKFPLMGCSDCVRAISAGEIAEDVCEGWYEKVWYHCSLLRLNQGGCWNADLSHYYSEGMLLLSDKAVMKLKSTMFAGGENRLKKIGTDLVKKVKVQYSWWKKLCLSLFCCTRKRTPSRKDRQDSAAVKEMRLAKIGPNIAKNLRTVFFSLSFDV